MLHLTNPFFLHPIDWTPYVEQLFTKFMVAFCLPVTYGQSGVRVKFGLSESGSFAYISRWIVSALGGNFFRDKGMTNYEVLQCTSYYSSTSITHQCF